MLFRKININMHLSATTWIIIIAIIWLAVISFFHYNLNFQDSKRKKIIIGYMPVITNLSACLLDDATISGKGIRFVALKFSSFAEMAEALRNDQIQVAFIIAPLAIVLKQQGEDVRIVYIGNRHESTLVTRKDLNIVKLSDLTGRTIAVPMRYSGHNISIQQLLAKKGLTGQIKVVEMNPPDMAAALDSGSLDAYYVGEPFAAQSIKNKSGSVLYNVEDVWPNFICNLVLVKESFIKKDSQTVQMLVRGAARSGLWAQKNIKKAAQIAADYWNQPVDLIEYAMNTPAHRIIFNRFIPREKEIQYLADQMVRFKLINNNDIKGLVDDRFAIKINLKDIYAGDNLTSDLLFGKKKMIFGSCRVLAPVIYYHGISKDIL